MESKMKKFSEVTVMWKPTSEVEGDKAKFIKLIKDKYKVKINNYWDIHKWSVEHIPEFWEEMWNFSGIICSQKFNQVIDLKIPMEENPKWFEGAKLNFAENLLKFRNERIAIISAGEDKDMTKITYAEMYEKAKLYSAAFRKFGLKKGDRVACFMSNREEPIFAMLGVVSIGAIWTGALPLLGAQATLNRFKLVRPRILLTIDRFQQKEEEKEMLHKVKTLADNLPSLEKVIIVPSKEESKSKDISSIPNSCFLDEFLKLGYNDDGTVPEMVFEQVPISHPVFISYTSGTTGASKPLVHGSGILLTSHRDYWLHHDDGRDLVTLSMSPVGWATWVLFSAFHSLGVTIVVYEGVPYFLSPTYLWDLIDECQISVLFATPSTLDDLEKKGYVPTEKHSLSSLKRLMSGGSVVKPQNYDFVYNKVKKDLKFFSGYGSTEIMSACMTIDASLPIYRGEITCPSLATNFECLDDSGKHVIGEPGELVLTTPLPSLPLGLWGNEDGSIYRKTYFSKFQGKFSIGDLGVINPVTKGFIIYCRSDETLKQRGCRFGSSEIYNVVNVFYEISDSLCVSQYSKKMNERAILFVMMRDGYKFDDDLVRKIRIAIENELTDRHVPDVIMETTDIPHNINGKKMEITVKKIINNLPYNDETVINKECLDFFRHIPPYEDD